MKIFNSNDGTFWGEKVNFVDKNNVVVGYDMDQSCCERADWFISDKITLSISENQAHNDSVLEDYVFDKEFFKEVDYIKNEKDDWNELDEGGMVIFRLSNGENELFLHLFNCHNGYYYHGFEMKDDKNIMQKGNI